MTWQKIRYECNKFFLQILKKYFHFLLTIILFLFSEKIDDGDTQKCNLLFQPRKGLLGVTQCTLKYYRNSAVVQKFPKGNNQHFQTKPIWWEAKKSF